MAKRPVEEEDEDRASDPNEDEDESASARSKEAEAADDDEESEDEESGDDESDDEDADDEESASDEDAPPKAAKSDEGAAEDDEEGEAEGDELAARNADADEDEVLPTQLGSQRYVFAAFFLAALLGTYILGRSFDALWQNLVNRDAVVAQAPWLTSVTDDGKQTYSMIAAGVISLLYTVHAYRKESVQRWTEEVSSELVKVKWPTRKEVIASTTVVLATSAIAVVYLFLLDRFWGFVSNLIYGKGT